MNSNTSKALLFDFARSGKCFLLLAFLSLFSIPTTAQQTEKTHNGFTMENCVSKFDTSGVVPTKAGYQYWFVDKNFLDGRTLKMSVVEPGKATHAPHKHQEDEFFFVLEGKAKFYLNGDSTIADAYSSFYCPSESLHGISNAGAKELKYLVIKKYILD